MLKANWEIASHGYKWIEYKNFSKKKERNFIQKAIKLHTATTGSKPNGWYLGRCTENTVSLVSELGYFDYSKTGNFGGICINNHYDNNDSAQLENKNKYKVGVITLDNLLDMEKCNFIKIDAECMELDILKGGIKFLEKFRPTMWIENHYEFPNKLNKYLLNIDYNLYWMYTVYYNKNNYFANDINHFGEIATLNVLAIPKENKKYCIDDRFDKIINENTKYTQCFRATF